MDIILQVIIYILLLTTVVLLWRKAYRSSEARHFWGLLAAAWTLNLLGNIAWIVHDLVTGTALSTISMIDGFYILRYVLIGYALWLYPVPLPRRAWFWLGGIMFAAGVVVWRIYFKPAMLLLDGDWFSFLGLASYPVLDAEMIALASLRYHAVRQSTWDRYAFLLLCGMLSYGIANTLNLTGYVFAAEFSGIWKEVFWNLTNVFLLIMVLSPDLHKKQELSE